MEEIYTKEDLEEFNSLHDKILREKCNDFCRRLEECSIPERLDEIKERVTKELHGILGVSIHDFYRIEGIIDRCFLRKRTKLNAEKAAGTN